MSANDRAQAVSLCQSEQPSLAPEECALVIAELNRACHEFHGTVPANSTARTELLYVLGLLHRRLVVACPSDQGVVFAGEILASHAADMPSLPARWPAPAPAPTLPAKLRALLEAALAEQIRAAGDHALLEALADAIAVEVARTRPELQKRRAIAAALGAQHAACAEAERIARELGIGDAEIARLLQEKIGALQTGHPESPVWRGRRHDDLSVKLLLDQAVQAELGKESP